MAVAGFNAVISVATGASATYSIINGITQFSIGEPRDMLDITDFADSNLKRKIAGLKDVTISMSGDLEIADTAYLNLRACFDAGTAAIVRVLPDGTNGKAYAMLVSNIERSASVDGKIEVSISAEHEGTIDPIVVGTGL